MSSDPLRSAVSSPAWNVADIVAEIEKPGYSILRAWLAIHGGMSARIALEEICQLVRALASASASPHAKGEELDSGALHDAIQALKVYQMEGEIDGKPYCYVLVRRREVHQAIHNLSAFPASLEAPQQPKT